MHNLLAQTHPNLRDEFLYCIDKNGNKDNVKTFNTLSTGSNYYALWKCPKTNCDKKCEHIYKAVIYSRTSKNPSGCPYCSGNKVCECNSFAKKHPELLMDWYDQSINPTEIAEHCQKKIQWKCLNSKCIHSHIWIATPSNRVINKTGCPYCSGNKICECDSFAMKQPDLTKEWHSNNVLKPSEISEQSHKKIQWKCLNSKCDHHVWIATPNDRVSDGTGCPYCANKKFCKCYCLASEFPELLTDEWDEQKNVKEGLDSFSLAPYSSKYAWWICKTCKYSWYGKINNRTSGNCGCPKCCKSKMEKFILNLLIMLKTSSKIQSYEHQWRLYSTNLKVDFVIITMEGEKIILEMDGIQHFEPQSFGATHKSKYEMFSDIQYSDQRKKEWCETNNIRLLRISYLVKHEDYEIEIMEFIKVKNVGFRLVGKPVIK